MPVCSALLQEGFDEEAACSVSCRAGVDDDGAYLSEMRTIDVERGAADELLRFGFDDGEGVDVLADLQVRAAKECTVAGETIDELMDGFGVVQLCFARLHRWILPLVRFPLDGRELREGSGRSSCFKREKTRLLIWVGFGV